MKDIIVIGAGLSGTLMVINLLKQECYDKVRIKWVEPNCEQNLGSAYSTNEDYLLNVPVEKMGAFSVQPEHFLNWSRANNYPVEKGDYLPRKLYRQYIHSILQNEINKKKVFHVRREVGDSIYLDYVSNLDEVRELRSVARAYVVSQDTKYNPLYISNHKSILGCLIEAVIAGNEDEFKTFKITCAGSDSPEIRDISEYIKKTYKLIETEESDLKIHIIKIEDEW